MNENFFKIEKQERAKMHMQRMTGNGKSRVKKKNRLALTHKAKVKRRK